MLLLGFSGSHDILRFLFFHASLSAYLLLFCVFLLWSLVWVFGGQGKAREGWVTASYSYTFTFTFNSASQNLLMMFFFFLGTDDVFYLSSLH